MHRIILSFMLLGLSAVSAADSLEPFTDSPAGKYVTGTGWLIADVNESSGFGVLVFTDTGYRVLPALFKTRVDVRQLLGRQSVIEAKILHDRSLEIVDISLPKN